MDGSRALPLFFWPANAEVRQSKELFAKVTGFLKDLEPAEVLEEDNKSCCALANGARVVSLPGDPDTLRGYSAPKRIIKVPAGRPFIAAVRSPAEASPSRPPPEAVPVHRSQTRSR